MNTLLVFRWKCENWALNCGQDLSSSSPIIFFRNQNMAGKFLGKKWSNFWVPLFVFNPQLHYSTAIFFFHFSSHMIFYLPNVTIFLIPYYHTIYFRLVTRKNLEAWIIYENHFEPVYEGKRTKMAIIRRILTKISLEIEQEVS